MRTTTTVACYITFYNALAGRPRRVIDTRPALGRADGRRSKLVAPADDDSHIIIIITTYVPVAREYIILLYYILLYASLYNIIMHAFTTAQYIILVYDGTHRRSSCTNTRLSVDILLLYTYWTLARIPLVTV